MQFSIVEYPDGRLLAPCHDVSAFDGDLIEFVNALAETMYAHHGVGIAAPQVGDNRRIVLIDQSSGEDNNLLVTLINPRVTWVSDDMVMIREGCLSLPGVVIDIKRASAIEIVYNDVMGAEHIARHSGVVARIIQHEIDHLDGIMMLDRVGKLTRRTATKDMGNK